MKLLIHYQTSTAEPWKYGNWQVISPRTFLVGWYLTMLGFKLIHVSKAVPYGLRERGGIKYQNVYIDFRYDRRSSSSCVEPSGYLDRSKNSKHRTLAFEICEVRREYALCDIETSQIARFMRPTWGPSGSCRPQVGPILSPMNLAIGGITSSIWRCQSKAAQCCFTNAMCTHMTRLWHLLPAMTFMYICQLCEFAISYLDCSG